MTTRRAFIQAAAAAVLLPWQRAYLQQREQPLRVPAKPATTPRTAPAAGMVWMMLSDTEAGWGFIRAH